MLLFKMCFTSFPYTESRAIFEEAMKDGKVSIRITNVLIQGEAGVGKTSTLSLLLEEPSPTTHHSTSLATHPYHRIVHYCVNVQDDRADTIEHSRSTGNNSPPTTKNFKQGTAESDSVKWKKVKLKEKIAKMISMFTATQKVGNDSVLDEAPGPSKQLKLEGGLDLPRLAAKKPSDFGRLKFVIDLRDEIIGLLSTDRNPAEVLGSHWIYIIDSGGQPHFHNLLPHFVHGLSVAFLWFV